MIKMKYVTYMVGKVKKNTKKPAPIDLGFNITHDIFEESFYETNDIFIESDIDETLKPLLGIIRDSLRWQYPSTRLRKKWWVVK